MNIVSMNYLLEAGVHFGHQKRRWNPKMKEYIYQTRDDIYIINLEKTKNKLEEAYEAVKAIAENEGKFLFVGTKKQAQEAVEESALRSEMFFINERWLGGTLTNFKTIRTRIKRMDDIDKMEADGTFDLLPKKEVIKIKKEYEKLNKNLRGIREMKKMPQAMIIVDPRKEEIAIKEARNLGIPVFGIVDTNCDPDMVDYVIPGNDDAVRAVKLIIGVLTNAICEATNKPLNDYITTEERPRNENRNNDRNNRNNGGNRNFEKRDFKNNRNFKREEKVVETKEVTEVKVEKEVEVKDFSKMTVTELKEEAKNAGIDGISAMKKADLIEALTK